MLYNKTNYRLTCQQLYSSYIYMSLLLRNPMTNSRRPNRNKFLQKLLRFLCLFNRFSTWELFCSVQALHWNQVKWIWFIFIIIFNLKLHTLIFFGFFFWILVTNFPMWTSTLVVAVAAVIYTSIVSASWFIWFIHA